MKKPALLGVGMIAAMYGLWLIYASGIINLMLSVVLYAPGILVFLYALKNREIKPHCILSSGALLLPC